MHPLTRRSFGSVSQIKYYSRQIAYHRNIPSVNTLSRLPALKSFHFPINQASVPIPRDRSGVFIGLLFLCGNDSFFLLQARTGHGRDHIIQPRQEETEK
jgi:hypothetical protein